MGLRTQKRRRRENKTDYKARLVLLKAGKPRIVIRRTNKYFILQVVESVEAQDKVLLTVSSKELLKNGWDMEKSGSLKSVPAGYATGLLFAKRIKTEVGSKKLEVGSGYIVDLGMTRTENGCRAFAVVKGLVDGGLDICANDKVFPSEERLRGEHCDLEKVVAKVKENLK